MNYALLLKEIARGPAGSRPLSRADSAALFTDALSGRMPDGVLGALLVALRMKGETVDELLGFADAWQAFATPVAVMTGPVLPVVIGSYNGARRQPNLLPLLALILQRLGLKVLVHGVVGATGRVTSAEIFAALGIAPSLSLAAVEDSLETQGIAFVPTPQLAPPLDRLLRWRDVLGVRHLGHTLVKALNPFACPSLRLVGFTHGAYQDLFRQFFVATRQDALIFRGHEGEAVASARRLPPIEWARAGEVGLLDGCELAETLTPCGIEAQRTAEYTKLALEDPRRLSPLLCHQAAYVALASGAAINLDAAHHLLRTRLAPGVV